MHNEIIHISSYLGPRCTFPPQIFELKCSQKVLSKTNLQKRNYELALVMKEKTKWCRGDAGLKKKIQSRVLTITSRFLQIVKI